MTKSLLQFKKLRKYDLLIIFILALFLRLIFRFMRSEASFWEDGYETYFLIAKSFVSGKGFVLGEQHPFYAFFPPGYPLLLSLAVLTGKYFLAIGILNSVMGAGTAVCGVLIGQEIFNRKVGILAGLMIAFYPYFVMHDSALQETVAYTFFAALTVLILIKAKRSSSLVLSAFAGILLSFTLLIRASLGPFIPMSLLWLAWNKKSKGLVALFFSLLTVLPWLIHTYHVVGAPMLTSQAGRFLWGGNNPNTFSSYPRGSMDESRMHAYEAFSNEELIELKEIENHELELNNWYAKKGWDYIKSHPLITVQSFIKKIIAAFSWNFSPAKPLLIQLVYFFSFTPIFLLGILGMILSRKQGSENSLICLLITSFCMVTGIFWAHTTHRTFLDIYFMIYTASVLLRFKKLTIS